MENQIFRRKRHIYCTSHGLISSRALFVAKKAWYFSSVCILIITKKARAVCLLVSLAETVT